jgi:hypothetical protein
MRAVKLRAVEENRKLTDMITDLLRRGLAQEPSASPSVPNRVNLPLVKDAHRARPDDEMTPERVAEVLIEEEAGTSRDHDAAMPSVRTPLTLDSDVAEQLKALARQRNQSVKVVLNHTIRAGFVAERGGGRPFKVEARPLGLRPDIDWTKALQLAADLEDEEIIRKLELRK